jgi:putative acetyltransferase
LLPGDTNSFQHRQPRLEFRNMTRIIHAHTAEHIPAVRQLFVEYSGQLGVDLCFQSFQQELDGLPGHYAPPDGRLLLVLRDGDVAGCVALRRLDDRTCEMKRLFIRPQFRGERLGKQLATALIEEAREIGYTRMRLDTLPDVMDKAIAMYRSIGFVEIAPYYFNPVEGAIFMELDLQGAELNLT